MIPRPEGAEYAPYYERYISLVKGNEPLAFLTAQIENTVSALRAILEERGGHRYAPDKWTIREVVGHMIDTERIFAYRALRFSRNDAAALPGFEQDDYVREGPYENCRLSDLIDEFAAVRTTTVALFRNLSPEAWLRRGTASNNVMSVRALAYVIAGHELHHMKVMRERYLA